MTTDSEIVTAETASAEKAFLGLAVRRARLPQPRNNAHLYTCEQQLDGSRELRQIIPGAPDPGLRTDRPAVFYHVSVVPHPISLVFSKVQKDARGHGWDFHVDGRLSVADSRRFHNAYALGVVRPEMPLSQPMVESWVANTVGPQVRDTVRSYVDSQSWEALKDCDGLPPSWWEKEFSAWLDEYGVAVQVDTVSWRSADAEEEKAEAARRKGFERIAQAKQGEREAELREAAAKAAYETSKAQIESDQRLSAQERLHQLQLLEKRHRKELLEADLEIENARRAAEKALLEHELALARLRKDAESAQRAEERENEADCRNKRVLQELSEMQAALARLPGDLLSQLAGRNAETANAAAEHLVSPEFNVPASVLARLGYRVEQQTLVESLRKKAQADGEPVQIRKMALVTRDIGTVKVKALPINTSLQFEFSTAKPGCVTLLNVGTSGGVYVHVPNAYIGVQRARAESGRTYCVPGPELLPWEALRQHGLDYVEVGPPGWEHLVVLISEKPLLKAGILANTSGDSPFMKLDADEIAGICERLSEQADDQWSAGVLSFLVG